MDLPPQAAVDGLQIPIFVWQALVGAAGAGVRIAIGHDRGEPQSYSKIFATMVSGTIMAATAAQGMLTYLNLPTSFVIAVAAA